MTDDMAKSKDHTVSSTQIAFPPALFAFHESV